jgi:hypothetical protein
MTIVDDPIINTLEKIVYTYDGVAELIDEKTLNVLLPQQIAQALKLEEETTFSTVIDTPNSQFVSYNSELLNRFSEIMASLGSVTALGVKYDGYLKTTGFEKSLAQKIVPQNGLIRFIDAKPENTRYIWCNVAYTAEADEKRIGMVSFIINEFTGVAPVDIGDALLWESDKVPVDDYSLAHKLSDDELSEIIEKISARLIATDLENWQAKLNRAFVRDEERLKAYYGSISVEIAKKIEHKGLDGDDKEKELARIEATKRELERKIADIRERYNLKVEAHLHSAMVLHLPTVHINCTLQRKKAKRDITLVWNPFTKIIEPLQCEISGEPVYEFYLDDKDAKIIAPSVFQSKALKL